MVAMVVPLVKVALLLLKMTVLPLLGLNPALEAESDVRSQFVSTPLKPDQLALTPPRQ